MTNEMKFNTPEERKEAFDIFCKKKVKCSWCKFNDDKGLASCCLHWLADEYEEPELPFMVAKASDEGFLRIVDKDSTDISGAFAKESAQHICDRLNAVAIEWHKRMVEKGE